MHFVGTMFVDLMVTLFFIGMAGSAVVVLVSFVEDFRELFGSDESAPELPSRPQSESASLAGPLHSASRVGAK
jgi:hypothetical protein